MPIEQSDDGVGKRSQRYYRSKKALAVGVTAGLIMGLLVVIITIGSINDQSDAHDMLSSQTDAVWRGTTSVNPPPPLTQDGNASAARLSVQALKATPILAAPLRTLGFALQNLRQNARGDALLSQAAGLGWRDRPTQIWLARAYLQIGNLDAASQHLDASMRTQSDPRDIYYVLDNLILNPDFARSLSRRLELNPEWRTPYLQYTSEDTLPLLEAKAALMNDLAASITPPTRDEVEPVTRSLINLGLGSMARKFWFAVLHISTGNIHDPDFQHASLEHVPFEWTLSPVLGASAIVSSGSSADDSFLHITTDGSASGLLASQPLALAAGDHFLKYRSSRKSSERSAFYWTIRCLSRGTVILDGSRAVLPSHAFNVPEVCGNQIVELRVRNQPGAANNAVDISAVSIE